MSTFGLFSWLRRNGVTWTPTHTKGGNFGTCIKRGSEELWVQSDDCFYSAARGVAIRCADQYKGNWLLPFTSFQVVEDAALQTRFDVVRQEYVLPFCTAIGGKAGSRLRKAFDSFPEPGTRVNSLDGEVWRVGHFLNMLSQELAYLRAKNQDVLMDVPPDWNSLSTFGEFLANTAGPGFVEEGGALEGLAKQVAETLHLTVVAEDGRVAAYRSSVSVFAVIGDHYRPLTMPDKDLWQARAGDQQPVQEEAGPSDSRVIVAEQDMGGPEGFLVRYSCVDINTIPDEIAAWKEGDVAPGTGEVFKRISKVKRTLIAKADRPFYKADVHTLDAVTCRSASLMNVAVTTELKYLVAARIVLMKNVWVVDVVDGVPQVRLRSV